MTVTWGEEPAVEFTWSEDERQYRAALRQYIAANARPGWNHNDRELHDIALKDEVVSFCEGLGNSGWLTPHWPTEYGGLASSPWERVIVGEEMWGAGEPRGPQYMNVNWIAPAIMMAGTDVQKKKYLTEMAGGSVLWCQGFSEPDSGTDLASLKTRADRDGDEYIINGQKIWTSYAHAADYCFLLVRTHQEAEMHKGISILLVPMDLPGIEVRDIPTPFVDHVVHEIFFNDVRVPVANRLGDENEGWAIIRHALSEERIGVARYAYSERLLEEGAEAAQAAGLDLSDPSLVEDMGDAFALFEAARTLMYVAVQERIDDLNGLRPMASTWRAIGAGMAEVATREILMEVMGQEGLIADSPADRYTTLGTFSPIAAGTYEIQLNIIARYCLGLPKGA